MAACLRTGENEAMKMPASKYVPKYVSIFVSTFLAMSAFVGAMAAAHAVTNAKQLFEQQERWSGGGQ